MNAPAFYILAFAALAATLMAVTRRELVHAVVYLVLSFFSLALIFFMMGAPLVAAIEVIVYAGAIMVLFLFIVMMIETSARPKGSRVAAWGPAALICAAILAGALALLFSAPGASMPAERFLVSPRAFGTALFGPFALAVEAASLMLLFAMVGALYLGRRD